MAQIAIVPAAPGMILGRRYRLQSVLGAGAMAQVWRAHDERLDRDIAVKIASPHMDSALRQRFTREVRIGASLSHPNIVAIYDAATTDGFTYLVMETADGGTLDTLIEQAPLPWHTMLEVTGQVCEALNAAHSAGVIHRDIKPGNILLRRDGIVKVCDFGIAHTATSASLTASGKVVGTALFMAPEQITGAAVGPWTDLYALGCLMYAMVTGRPPFTGGTPVGIAWRHLHQQPVPLTRLQPLTPPMLAGFVASLLAKDPAERPRSAAEVLTSLEAIAADLRRPNPKPSAKARAHQPNPVADPESTAATLVSGGVKA